MTAVSEQRPTTPLPSLALPRRAPEADVPPPEEEGLPHRVQSEGILSENLTAFFGTHEILHGITLACPARQVTAIIGPSGCGKTTFIRCLNRMHEVVPGARAGGRVIVHGQDIYAPGTDPVLIRRKVGMVFQRPNPFPAMSTYGNVAAGLRLNGQKRGRELDEIVERSLRQAALWDEVKDRLHQGGTHLSGGQQQRLCIART